MIAALLGIAGICPALAQPNPLIGTWHLSAEALVPSMPNLRCAVTDLTFTASAETQVVREGTSSTYPVRFIPSPQQVYVLVGPSISNAKIYKVHSNNEIYLDAVPGCTYRRVR